MLGNLNSKLQDLINLEQLLTFLLVLFKNQRKMFCNFQKHVNHYTFVSKFIIENK